MSLVFDGERYVPEIGGVIHAEHLHRYRLARVLAAGKDVLDVACGEGYGSVMLAELAQSVVGVDISAETVEYARQAYPRENLRFVLGDCAELPCEVASFDLVVSFETIEHHDRHDEMLREFRRVLRSGGILLISSPNRPEFNLAASEPNPFHVKELDFAEFAALLQSYFPHVVFYAQRVLNGSCIAPLNDQVSEFRHFDITGGGSSEIPRPIYFLALASDGPLPSLGASVYETPQVALPLNEMGVAEARLYISEILDGIPQPYTESRGAAVLYPISSRRQTIRFPLPADLKPLARARLDPANLPAALFVHGLALLLADGTEVWRWDGDIGLLKNVGGLAIRDAAEGLLLLSLNDDPQFDLAIPPEVLERVKGGANLVVDFTPRPLLDTLPELLAQEDVARNLPALTQSRTVVPIGMSRQLVEVAQLMKEQIIRRNATIASQRDAIDSMRGRQQQLEEHILRAEAQLELLKEFFLATGQHNERL